ncbi:MAG: DUF4249 domain-containing protein [Bacteroidota bacterium]
MKTVHLYIALALFGLLGACTDVIEVDVPEAPLRLVVEASLDWEQGTPGNEQSIQLRTSTPYFENQDNPPVTDASVEVVNLDTGETFIFTEGTPGNYSIDTFIPILGNRYQLDILYEGERYRATETLFPVSPFTEISQSTEEGEDDVLEVNVSFQDPESIANWYYLRFQGRGDRLPELYYIEDEFIDGNEFSIFYEKIEDEDENIQEFQPGDIVDIAFYGISEDYYNYLQLLIDQFDSAGEPFSATPVPLVGNCINLDNPDNIAYGYFRVTESTTAAYTFN